MPNNFDEAISELEQFYNNTNPIKDDIDSKMDEIGFNSIHSKSFFMTKVWSAIK
ncbi:uncharacterized protein METZ01_LOCUS468740 [marine metagenome]|uniref:Uncharacterized protein n=1 Tax=marine metagenome TaxID=408172 RepID=A0A383B6R2_9ZZZZ